jgi:hypothetical protein
LASSLSTSSSAEAAALPSPVAEASIIDGQYCVPSSYGYFNTGIYTFSSFMYPYAQPFGSNVCAVANCPGPLQLYQYQLVCPGPPAVIEMPAINAVTCASATNIDVKVRDAIGLNVHDGTTVSFSAAPFGTITGTVGTNGGEASASLTTPTKTSGVITVTVTAGSVTRTQTIDVSCSAPGSVSYGGGGSTSTQAPAQTYTVPSGGGGSTGGGGGSTGGGGGGGY